MAGINRGGTLNVFSVAAEALHFGWRRFGTILRVGLMPMTLMLVLNMASVFLWLSLAYGKAITFADVVRAGARWDQVVALAAQAQAQGIAANSSAAWTLWLASLGVNLILLASFMAPLTRYAGLGEKPAPGVIRAPFGPDQIRFIAAGVLSTVVFLAVAYAPIAVATFSVIGFMATAMTTPFASFPDADSLHTVDVIFGADRFGVRWLYGWQVWGAAAAALGVVLVTLIFGHVAPRREDRGAGIGLLGRGLGALAGVAVYFAAAAWIYNAIFKNAAPSALALADGLSGVLFMAGAAAVLVFAGLRLYPYAGVAVCRRSMAIAGSLRVTRRHNLFRLLAAFALIGGLLFGAQLLITIAFSLLTGVIGALFGAAESAARLGGAEGGWAARSAALAIGASGVAANALWALFTYGVSAGLMGRLYRESEKI
ncbi:MAG: hypothetical protein ACK4NP_12930 [Parvularculaceae bacterium]